jgi:biotin carboxyl carrier protein
MRFEIVIASKVVALRIDPQTGSNGKKFSIKAQNKDYQIEILSENATGLIVSIENRVYSLKVFRRTQSQVVFAANGRIIEASTKKNAVSQKPFSGIASIGEIVKSNFPAKIVKIMARPGEPLNQGDTIIVVEAMKMEAQIRVPGNCVVREIFVKEGEMVERGKTLARLEPR